MARPPIARIAVITSLVLGAGNAAALPAQTNISLVWNGEPPSSALIDDTFSPLPLHLNPGGRSFTGIYTHAGSSGTFLREMSVRVTYGDGEQLAVPVRLWPSLTGVRTTAYRAKVDSCWGGYVEPLERTQGDVERTLKAYFTARAIYLIDGPNGCKGKMRRRVARAWFDRAYELTRLAPYYRLSEEAASAYEPFDRAYVTQYRKQALGGTIKLANDLKLQALRSGDAHAAIGINNALLETYRSDPLIAEVGLEFQGLSEGQLEKDGALFRGQAALNTPFEAISAATAAAGADRPLRAF